MGRITVNGSNYIAEPFYQWDKNQILTISGLDLTFAPEIHFTNGLMDRSIVRQASKDSSGIISVNVPDSLLQKPHSIIVYVCGYEENTFTTYYKFIVKINERIRPSDYTLENNEEIYSFTNLEYKLNNTAVQLTEQINTFAQQEDRRINAIYNTMTSPFIFKGNCQFSELPETAEINDTYYVTDLKCRMTWNGSSWYQSSLNESEYEDELSSVMNGLTNVYTSLKNDCGMNVIRSGEISPYIIEYNKWSGGESTVHSGFRSFRFDVSQADSVTADTVTRSGTDTYVLLKENQVIRHSQLTGGTVTGITINTEDADTLILCVFSENENLVKAYGNYIEPEIESQLSVSEIQDGFFYQYGLNKPVSTYENIIYDISGKNVVYLNHHVVDAVSNLYTVLDEDGQVIGYASPQGDASQQAYVEAVNYPIYVGNAKKLAISHLKTSVYSPVVFGSRKTTNTKINELEQHISSFEHEPFEDKKIVWLGTSIPAGQGGVGMNSSFAYPQMVGEILKANVVNEAIGESSVHCRCIQRVTAENPYGFEENWIKCAKCLSNTIEETQWLIDHKDDYSADGFTRIFTTNRPETLTNDLKAFYLSCSYENKIAQHLNDTDLWVFDHGHNDRMDANTNGTENYTDEYVMQIYGNDTRFTFEGAMNYLLTYIKNADNFAKIVIVGEYENQKMYKVPPKQQAVSDSWNIPLYEQWKHIGWSQHTITTTGYWNDQTGLWVESGGESQTITLLQRFVRDNIHPHSDFSGYALRLIAENIAKWIKNQIII